MKVSVAMLVRVEPAASALEEVLRQVVVTLADTPAGVVAPVPSPSVASPDAGVP